MYLVQGRMKYRVNANVRGGFDVAQSRERNFENTAHDARLCELFMHRAFTRIAHNIAHLSFYPGINLLIKRAKCFIT